MCNLGEVIERDAIERTTEKVTNQKNTMYVKNLMDKLKISATQDMNILKIPENERKYISTILLS